MTITLSPRRIALTSAAVLIAAMLFGCIRIERIQVGPDKWPESTSQPTTQPASNELAKFLGR